MSKPSWLANATQVAPDRKTVALAAAKRLTKECSDELGFHGAGYWTDFAGSDTSNYDWDFWISVALLIELPLVDFVNLGGVYDHRKAEWMNGFMRGYPARVPIAELKKRVSDRIRELGLSDVRLFEFMAAPHSIAEEVGDRGKTFDEKMSKFRGA